MTSHSQHAVALRGPSPVRPRSPAVLVDIEADDFVAALSQAITRDSWPRFGWPAVFPIARLADQGAPRALFQAIHRRFNLVLLDTHCELFGTPRLDPRKIESAGFVVRRWAGPDASAEMPSAAALADPAHWQAWKTGDAAGAGNPGWGSFGTAEAFDADPDPKRRPAIRTGNLDVDARLAAVRVIQPAEAVNALHALMPEIGKHTGRTLLYGVVPTSEALRTARSTAIDYTDARAPSPARDSYVAHLSPYLQRNSLRALPGARSNFDASWLAGDQPVDAAEPDASDTSLQREQFAAFIRQLAFEFDLNGRGSALLALLDEIAVGIQQPDRFAGTDRATRGASAFLAACVHVVTDAGAPPVTIPDDFGPVPAGWLARFVDASLSVLEGRAAEARTLEGRFDDASALYAIRAFVRVRGEPACPLRLVWSEMTPLYRVAPWYASTGAPQARIALPAFDRASLAAMKPNVAFDVPPALQNLLMRNKPEDMLKSPKSGGELGIGWLCSFSIPIITLCAFILLNVVLSLLNLVFFWLPLVKICLPVPKKK